MNNLAKNLNRLNQENNLTIKEVANKLLVNPRTLQNYYNGTREPRIDTLIELLRFGICPPPYKFVGRCVAISCVPPFLIL